MPIEINRLETDRFGVVAARIIDPDASPDAIDEAAQAQGVQFLTVRMEVSDLPRVHAFEAAGYQLMDTLVYYDRALDVAPLSVTAADGVTCRLAAPADAPVVAELARIGFQAYMGHYHADPRLDDGAADAAYVEWAETSTARVSHNAPVVIAQLHDQPVGFVTLRFDNAKREVEFVLSAVHPVSQGLGVYGTLMAEALHRAKDIGAERAFTSTQINNYAVQRVWSRLGFVHCRSLYTFHRWL